MAVTVSHQGSAMNPVAITKGQKSCIFKSNGEFAPIGVCDRIVRVFCQETTLNYTVIIIWDTKIFRTHQDVYVLPSSVSSYRNTVFIMLCRMSLEKLDAGITPYYSLHFSELPSSKWESAAKATISQTLLQFSPTELEATSPSTTPDRSLAAHHGCITKHRRAHQHKSTFLLLP